MVRSPLMASSRPSWLVTDVARAGCGRLRGHCRGRVSPPLGRWVTFDLAYGSRVGSTGGERHWPTKNGVR